MKYSLYQIVKEEAKFATLQYLEYLKRKDVNWEDKAFSTFLFIWFAMMTIMNKTIRFMLIMYANIKLKLGGSRESPYLK